MREIERLREALRLSEASASEANVARGVRRDLEFRWCLRVGETGVGLWTTESILESHGPCESLELSKVRIGLETAELRLELRHANRSCELGDRRARRPTAVSTYACFVFEAHSSISRRSRECPHSLRSLSNSVCASVSGNATETRVTRSSTARDHPNASTPVSSRPLCSVQIRCGT